MTSPLLLFALLPIATGCGAGPSEVRDSLGQWVLEDLETVLGDSIPLSRVYRVALGPGGHLVVVDGPPVRVLLRRSDGTILQIGARGGGPSEYSYVNEVGFVGDTIWVTDARGSKGIFFDLDGQHLRTERIALPPANRYGSALGPLRPLADGSWLLSEPAVSITGVMSGWIDSRVYLRMADSRVDTVFVQPLPQHDFLRVPLGEWGPGPNANFEAFHPLRRGPLFAHGSSGSSSWIIDRSPPAHPDSSRFEIRVLDLTGDTIGSITVPYTPIEVSSDWKDSWYADRAKVMASFLEAPQARLETILRESVSFPGYFPPVAEAKVGVDGRLWLRESRPDTLRSDWLVLGASGHLEGRLSAPNGFRLVAADSTSVVGVLKDELDVETVVHGRIRIQARAGGTS